MSDDLYPERVLQAATTAGAKAIYAQNLKAEGIYPNEAPSFEELPPLIRRRFLEAALPIVTAAIGAIPDGRWAIWQQGATAVLRAMSDDLGISTEDRYDLENPYPPPEFDISDLTGD